MPPPAGAVEPAGPPKSDVKLSPSIPPHLDAHTTGRRDNQGAIRYAGYAIWRRLGPVQGQVNEPLDIDVTKKWPVPNFLETGHPPEMTPLCRLELDLSAEFHVPSRLNRRRCQ